MTRSSIACELQPRRANSCYQKVKTTAEFAAPWTRMICGRSALAAAKLGWASPPVGWHWKLGMAGMMLGLCQTRNGLDQRRHSSTRVRDGAAAVGDHTPCSWVEPLGVIPPGGGQPEFDFEPMPVGGSQRLNHTVVLAFR
jgi:hypothetical protein